MDLINALRAKCIPVKLDADPDWATDYAMAFNSRLGNPPDVVVVPHTVRHICDAIIIANQKGAKVQARSGGHSYAAFSSRKTACHILMVVDLRNFQEVRFLDPRAEVVVVDGGIRLGRLALDLYRLGGRALAHGTCPSVGIGGHFTHGGYGHTSRAWGLAMDQIVGMDVVLANGCLVQATATQNEHLFWALRGAADSFGVVVRFHLRTKPAPRHSLRFSAEYPDIATDYRACTEAVMALQRFAKQDFFDKEMSFGIQLGPGRFGINGVFLDRMEYQSTCVPHLFEVLTGLKKARTGDKMLALHPTDKPCSPRLEVVDWVDLLKDLAGDDPLITPEPFTESGSFYANSLMVPQGFCAKALGDYFRYIAINSPAPIHWFAIIDIWGGHDSEISKTLNVAPSVCRRDAFWVVQNYGYVDEGAAFPPSGLEFIKGLNQAMARSVPEGGAYVNYPDSDLAREQAGRMHYGSSYDRLKALKQVLDPNDVFHNAQSIGTSE